MNKPEKGATLTLGRGHRTKIKQNQHREVTIIILGYDVF